jgi:hypothetical protein
LIQKRDVSSAALVVVVADTRENSILKKKGKEMGGEKDDSISVHDLESLGSSQDVIFVVSVCSLVENITFPSCPLGVDVMSSSLVKQKSKVKDRPIDCKYKQYTISSFSLSLTASMKTHTTLGSSDSKNRSGTSS